MDVFKPTASLLAKRFALVLT